MSKLSKKKKPQIFLFCYIQIGRCDDNSMLQFRMRSDQTSPAQLQSANPRSCPQHSENLRAHSHWASPIIVNTTPIASCHSCVPLVKVKTTWMSIYQLHWKSRTPSSQALAPSRPRVEAEEVEQSADLAAEMTPFMEDEEIEVQFVMIAVQTIATASSQYFKAFP